MNPSSLRRTCFAVCSSCDLLTAGAYPCRGTFAPLHFPAPPGLSTGFAFQTSRRLRSSRPAGGGSYTQIHDLRWQNCLISDPHRPARAGGCDPLTTAWIKLAVACAPAKNSRGLLTVTSLCFFRSTVSGFCGASHCCQHLAHFRLTLLPASRGCRFQHCTRLAPTTASGKLAALCSSP
jgi:hypothetical protein